MKILVAGGAGYIGSHAVCALLDKGYEVIVADNLSKGHSAAVKGAPLYTGDLRDREFLDKVFSNNHFDGVMNFAAFSLVGESVEKPLEYYENNVVLSMRLLEAMVKYEVKNLVFSSTAAVYGEPEKQPIFETDLTCPTNPYGQTKLAVEGMIKWASNAHGINYAVLRYFNVAGARNDKNIGEDHHPETHLIPIILQAALGKRENISIFGSDYPTRDGTCIRDYIDVCDLCDAHVLALEHIKNNGKNDTYNLGNGNGFSVREVIEAARIVTGKAIKSVDMPRRAGDPPQLVAASNKAADVLGWHPKNASIEKIISSAWQWHRENPNGYNEI